MPQQNTMLVSVQLPQLEAVITAKREVSSQMEVSKNWEVENFFWF
jgi:hypothetical protein